MRTIEKGRQQSGWARPYVCTGYKTGGGGCKSKLLVEQDDLFQATEMHQGEIDRYVAFRCHECHVVTVIEDAPFNPMELPSFGEWKRTHNFPKPPKTKPLGNR